MLTSAEAPLMQNLDTEHDNELCQTNATSSDGYADGGVQDDNSSPGLFVWLLTLSAGMSGLLFGYDTGVISATLVSINTSLSNRTLTDLDKSLITSCTSLFALLMCPFSSILADTFGRKRVILYADVLFVIGAIMQACSKTVASMVLGRSIVGAAVGAASFVVPLFIAELAPAKFRGRLITMNVLSITFGQVVAYVVGWAFAEYGSKKTGWRWMVGLGATPASVQALLLLLIPETPRWLVRAGRVPEARVVVAKVTGSAPQASRLVDSIISNIEIEVEKEIKARRLCHHRGHTQTSWLDSWNELIRVPRNRRALTIACVLQGLQQLCGFNSLMYFSATIFAILGFKSPTLTSLVVAVTNFLFTVAALFLIDKTGRRRILLASIPFMIMGLLLSSHGFTRVVFPGAAGSAENGMPETSFDLKGAALEILISIMIFVAAYAIGIGNVPWMQSELFPLTVRSLGSGISTATNWGANFVVGLTFLPLMDLLSPSLTFLLYALVCIVGLFLIWTIYPETAGLSLEDATKLLENGWGV